MPPLPSRNPLLRGSKPRGFPASDIFVGGAIPSKYNVVVRYHGTGGQKPILLLAHIDVVEAKREDWSIDPFLLTEKDGYFYGRGTSDDKAQAAIWVENLIRYKEGTVSARPGSDRRSNGRRRKAVGHTTELIGC